ncbi:LPD1 domain-containing protein [Roseibium sp. RKSG952]|uniref:LPD1 domain-containing protein n=1 Tax=Roseibium sp. RKSG952 TaxID=2529384 RepID=UPI0012BD013C|nr:LPD1 domain-containing protein [Roseibium sp. RKSG952]MTH95452.1 hypothetical protein [Roseibium sp. RKSG952]
MTSENTNRKIEDAGEKIGGARKDFDSRALDQADIEGMTDEEVGTLVTRDNVWPNPDWEIEVGNGLDPVVAAAIKTIRSKVDAKPQFSNRRPRRETAENYVANMKVVVRHVMACKTEADLYALGRTLLDEMGRQMWSVVRGRKSPFHVTDADTRKAKDLVDQGFPGKIPAWRRGVKIREIGGDIMAIKGQMILGRGFKSREELLAWLEENNRSPEKSSAPRGKKPVRPHLASLKRIGGETARGERDVDENEFIETFGYRGVEFGLWLDDAERQTVLNTAYDALSDFSEVLGVPMKAIGLQGTNALAFGSRGGGSFAAHYEPDRKVTNLSRIRGAGSLAHEKAHAIDHLVGFLAGIQMEDVIPSGSGWHSKACKDRTKELSALGPDVADAWDRVMRTLYYTPKSKEEGIALKKEKVANCEAEIARVHKAEASWKKAAADPKRAVDRKFKKDYRSFQRKLGPYMQAVEQQRNNALAELEACRSAPEAAYFGVRPSDYANEAQKLCGKTGEYWVRSNEMFARAFECWTFDQLAARGAKNDYLVYGVEDGRFADRAYRGNPYPAGEERVRINEAIGHLVRTIAPLMKDGLDLDLSDAPTL